MTNKEPKSNGQLKINKYLLLLKEILKLNNWANLIKNRILVTQTGQKNPKPQGNIYVKCFKSDN